jgi:O-antigen ligase
MPKRPPPRPQRKAERARRPAAPPRRRALQATEVLLWLVVLLPPLVLVPTAKEPFRLPKLMLAEWLALASLLPLCWELRRRAEVGWRELLELPVLRAVLPLLLVATVGLASTDHPLQVRQALPDLWIGAACLVGWSAGLPARRLERPLAGLLLPGAVLALLGILQFHGVYRPFELLGVTGGAERLAVTSLAGNPGELGAFLLLAALCGGWWVARAAPGPLRWGGAAALALCLYGLAVTLTLAALAALAAAGLVFAALALPPRRAAALLGGGLVAAALLAAALPPLRVRLAEKAAQVLAGEWNEVLTGRADGWRAATWMAARHPWTGVGHGAFAAEFVPAKEALLARGVGFYAKERRVFANAHSEPLEVAATMGLPGVAALLWGVAVLAASARRIREPRLDRAFAWAGLAALAILSLVHFPFRTALVGYPALLFFAWVLRRSAEAAE